MLQRNLPTPIETAAASLPATYEAAKAALADCAGLDECQDWADKAAALASYAKQANDDELMKMATRIRDRAIRRAGELLKQVEPAGGARSDLGRAPTRGSVARDAGMSHHQAKQALRVASLPAADFERQVESPNPPTVTDRNSSPWASIRHGASAAQDREMAALNQGRAAHDPLRERADRPGYRRRRDHR